MSNDDSFKPDSSANLNSCIDYYTRLVDQVGTIVATTVCTTTYTIVCNIHRVFI